jgi:aminoacylase
MTTVVDDERAVAQFRDYIRINTAPPEPQYDAAVRFLAAYLHDAFGISSRVVGLSSGFPVLLATVEGLEPSLPSLLLNSHTDVVPCDRAQWHCDPFGAELHDGRIYGRGTQDMKSVGIQYIEAVGRLVRAGTRLRRTVHLCFVPDEELGGKRGMKLFLDTPEWRALNVGLALDEGLANPRAAFTVFYGERAPWWVRVFATGNVGHGSRFIEGTALQKLHDVCAKFLAYRAEQKAALDDAHGCKTLGDVTTVNLTNIEGGIGGQPNVIPGAAHATFDIRIAPTVDLVEFKQRLDSWCAVDGVRYEFLQYHPEHFVSTTDPADKWWAAFAGAFKQLGHAIEPEVFPAATDSRFIRAHGIPAYGFSPMSSTPILLHDHNEFVFRDEFVRGIGVMQHLVQAMANVAD